MNREIYKHILKLDGGIQEVKLAEGAEILCAKVQRSSVCLWESHPVSGSGNLKTRNFVLVGTGFPYESQNLKYIDTVLLEGGYLVLHLFEETTDED